MEFVRRGSWGQRGSCPHLQTSGQMVSFHRLSGMMPASTEKAYIGENVLITTKNM